MPDMNFENRTIFHSDNLAVLRGMNSETIDLIATDPPFNKNRDFHATPDSLASGTKFTDRWSWDKDVHEDWWDAIKDDWQGVYEVIDAARAASGDDMAAFLCWLGVRVIEMRRILKPTGSLYLHIDHTAHAWVKAMLDGIFGRKNFRNEIVWCYSGGGVPKNDYPRKHDTLLRYTKSNKYIFNTEYKPYKENTQQVGKHSTYSGGHDIPLKRGTPVTDWWTDIKTVTGWSPERNGYPTQKPLALYERIIKASSNQDDIVLDPFAGCATTPVAAERLGRQWVAIDIWDDAYQTVLDRLESEGLAVQKEEETEQTEKRLITFGDVHYTKTAPERTDLGEVNAPDLRLRAQRSPEPWEKLTHKMIVEQLTKAQSISIKEKELVICAGCGRELENPFMELDHILPRADRGTNDITNRILLCRPCNGYKSSTLTLSGLVKRNKKEKWMYNERQAKEAQGGARLRADKIRNGEINI